MTGLSKEVYALLSLILSNEMLPIKKTTYPFYPTHAMNLRDNFSYNSYSPVLQANSGIPMTPRARKGANMDNTVFGKTTST